MLRTNPNLYPAGGHRFKETDGTVHKADTWRMLLGKIIMYRKVNKLPPGEPEAELHAQRCAENPHTCTDVSGAPVPPQPEETLKSRVLKWLTWLKRRVENREEIFWAPREYAQNRVGVCNMCPFQEPAGGGCSTCRKAIKGLSDAILGGRPSVGKGESCKILGHYNPVAAWLEEVPLDDARLPHHCWRKKR